MLDGKIDPYNKLALIRRHMHSNDTLISAMYSTLLAFYVPLLFFLRAKSNLRRAERTFYRGMISIFENSAEGEDPIAEVAILYKRLSENYTEITKKFRSPTELIEDLSKSLSNG
jgi:hypothetical protein